METTGTLEEINIDYKTGKPKISFLINDKNKLPTIEELKGIKLKIIAKKDIKKRSLNANNYFWKLLTEYSEEKEIDAIEEYRERIKRLGIFRVSRVEAKDVETYKKSWENWGTAWFCEVYDTEYLENIEFKILHLYYGSSSFNSKQMSRLINDLVEDCRDTGIETKPKEEIESLLKEWDKK